MSDVNTARVLNLIAKVDMKTAPLKRWAVVKLLRWQPAARGIRFEGKCDNCRRSKLYLSYQLPGDVAEVGSDYEPCGFYCPSCGFGNGGARRV